MKFKTMTFLMLWCLCLSFISVKAHASSDWRLEAFDEAQSIFIDCRTKRSDKLLEFRPDLKNYLDFMQKFNNVTSEIERRVFVFKIKHGYAIQKWTSPWTMLDSITSTEELKQLADEDSSIKDLYEEYLKFKEVLRRDFDKERRLSLTVQNIHSSELRKIDDHTHNRLVELYSRISDKIQQA